MSYFIKVLNTEEIKDNIQSLFIGSPQIPVGILSTFDNCNRMENCDVDEKIVDGLNGTNNRKLYISIAQHRKGLIGTWIDSALLSCTNQFSSTLDSICLYGCDRIKDDTVILSIKNVDRLIVSLHFKCKNVSRFSKVDYCQFSISPILSRFKLTFLIMYSIYLVSVVIVQQIKR